MVMEAGDLTGLVISIAGAIKLMHMIQICLHGCNLVAELIKMHKTMPDIHRNHLSLRCLTQVDLTVADRAQMHKFSRAGA
jgi:hypothetical protein